MRSPLRVRVEVVLAKVLLACVEYGRQTRMGEEERHRRETGNHHLESTLGIERVVE